MSKKKKNQEEPWSRRFGEDENYDSRQYSRSARKSTKKEVAPLSKVLLFLFLALLIIPFATYYWHEQTKAAPEPQTPDQVMINKQSSTSSVESEAEEEPSLAQEESRREESFADAETTEKPNQPVTENEEEVADESNKPEAEEEVEQESPANESQPEDVEEAEEVPETDENTEYNNTYTVQAGDNLFRIALNHGMDLEELKSVNGLTSDIAEIGQVLKVR